MTERIPSDGLSPPARTWAVISIAIAITLTVLDSSIANVALPVIAHDFGAKPSEAIWIVNGYQLAIVMALLPLAALSEIIGFRKVYVAGLAVFAAASVACALSPNLPVLTAARALQGLGAAGVMSVNGGLIRFIWPSRLLGRGIGINAVVISVAAAVGPSIASAILAVGPWPWLFAINVPIALTALVLAARVLPANPLSKRPFDAISALLNAIAFGALITGLDLLTRTPNIVPGAGLTGLGLGAGALLARREWSRPTPLVPFDLLRIRMFGLSVATSIAAFAAQTLAFVSLPFHFEDTLHRGQVATGLLLTPWPAAVAVAAPVAGWLSDRMSTALLCAAGLTLMAAGFVALALLGGTPTTADIVWRMALCGLGFGLFQTPNNRMMLTSAPRERGGAAGGMLGTARLTGQIIGAVLTAILLELMAARGEIAALVAAATFAMVAAAISLTRMGAAVPTKPTVATPEA